MQGLIKGRIYLGITYPRLSLDLALYLKQERDHDLDKRILDQLINGVSELHQLGFIHGDLRAEHVMLDIH